MRINLGRYLSAAKLKKLLLRRIIMKLLFLIVQKNEFDPEIQEKLNMTESTAAKLQGLIAQKTRQAQEEIANKSNERKVNLKKNQTKKDVQRKKAADTTDETEQELQRETSNLIRDMKETAQVRGVSEFGKAVMDVLNNYQVAINTTRSMAKNMYDGLFFLTNDVRSLEQNQSVILTRLDRLDSKVRIN